MKKINILVWVGLFINIIMLSGVAWYASSIYKISVDELTYAEWELSRMLSFMVTPFCIAITIQIISLPVLFKLPKLGLTLAIIGSVIMLPLSLMFMVGYVFSYEKFRNKDLTVFNKQPADIALYFKSSQLTMQGVVFIALGLIVGFIGINTGWLVAGAGLVVLCNSFRLKDRIMIGRVKDKLILTPALYADTYLIPLSDVSLTLENNRLFKLYLKSAGVDRKCTFRKGMIEGKNYQIALEDILSKLTEQDKK